MTKSEVEGVKARYAGSNDLTSIVGSIPSDIPALIADRERLVEILKPIVEYFWPSNQQMPAHVAERIDEACILLRAMGEIG